MQKAKASKSKTKAKPKTKITPVQPATTPTVTVTAPTIPPKKQYLSNKVLLEEVKKCKKKGEMSNTLAKMLQTLCDNYGRKGNFVNYSYNEDMRSYAMMSLVKTWKAFKPEKSNNPFAFFTQCIKHSFIQYLNQEKRQRNIRDHMLVNQGLNPSFSFTDTGHDRHYIDDEQDFQVIEHDANLLKRVHEEVNGEDGTNVPEEESVVTVDSETNTKDDSK